MRPVVMFSLFNCQTPGFLLDTLYNHFDDSYESSNFEGKLSKCPNHFYQLTYFLVHLHAFSMLQPFLMRIQSAL